MTVMTTPPVALDPEVVASLEEQVAKLPPGEPYLAVLAGGRVFVRSTRGLPQTVIQLWRKHPAMMVPDSASYRPEVRCVNVEEL
ncbi:MAG TPA: hypothetical protein VKS82_16210 [Streptosporangiaceae bacterium]|jgi:hypothetical protein|nr:hypothetical protein [Streptosporangiaceae bacterium]